MLLQGKAELSWLASPTSREGAGKWASLPHRVPDSGIWPTLLCLLYRFEIKGATQVEQWQNTCGSDPSTNCGRSGHNKKEKHPVAGHLYHQKKKFCSKLLHISGDRHNSSQVLPANQWRTCGFPASLEGQQLSSSWGREGAEESQQVHRVGTYCQICLIWSFFSTGLPLFRIEKKKASEPTRGLFRQRILWSNIYAWFIGIFSFWFWIANFCFFSIF